jgi:hypothetical protein
MQVHDWLRSQKSVVGIMFNLSGPARAIIIRHSIEVLISSCSKNARDLSIMLRCCGHDSKFDTSLDADHLFDGSIVYLYIKKTLIHLRLEPHKFNRIL